ncbi:hypothetical protein GDO78_003795 [Eleutherodactylus coqui]|uniref:HMG box domain-containing protein n=1 Tax=Eleutherodactylus coqui TaxID=57060 RepID=A0A8J6K513_ELECQ|nr:hypothetical protein GDO78_003795 [Eleutherodactylus coqui]
MLSLVTFTETWSPEDMLILLKNMKSIIPSQDISKFKTTESHMDWNDLAFKNFTGPMCRQKWVEISSEVRKFWTVSEIVHDAEERVTNLYKGKKLKKHPKFPKKPLAPYFRFFIEKKAQYVKLHPEMSNLDLSKILSKDYKELPDEEKMKYIQDFQDEKQEFEKNIAKFREEHPDLMPTRKSVRETQDPPQKEEEEDEEENLP